MVFSSQFFLFLFLPLCLILYYGLPKVLHNAVLLLFSFVFYAWGEVNYLWLIVVSILFNYATGLWLEKSGRKKYVITIGIIVNLTFLVYFKYAAFLCNAFHIKVADSIKNMVLPLGISFYTFHSISYLVDIYRKKVTAQPSLTKMGLYIVNFAQLIAGPIIRYHDVASQLTNRRHLVNRFANGLCQFIIGLSKKILIANIMGQMSDAVFKASPEQVGIIQAWVGVLAYTLQIYFDFSGYSDMAIGLGRMFGFEFKRNFNFPYISKSIKEFWRRWHISLSNWFRDYLYIPLGGNKYGNTRTALNLFIVFTLCGLWHGAQVTFLFWGLYHGAFLSIERGWFGRILKKLPNLLRNLYMWLVVMVGWVFFRSDNLDKALHIIKKMFLIDHSVINPSADINSYMNNYFFIILILALLFALKIPYGLYITLIKGKTINVLRLRNVGYATLFILLLLCIANVVSNNYNPFIYYRF